MFYTKRIIVTLIFIVTLSSPAIASSDPLLKAVKTISKDLSSGLPTDKPLTLAVIPPRSTGTRSFRDIERRITELLTNNIKEYLPGNCILSERFNLSRIFDDIFLYGKDEDIDTVFDQAGVHLYITGSYTLLTHSKSIEFLYRAVRVGVGDQNKIIATSRAVNIPMSMIYESSEQVLLLTKPEGIISAEGGREAVRQAFVMVKSHLTNNGVRLLEYDKHKAPDDFVSLAERLNASHVVVLHIKGNKSYTDMGFIKGYAQIIANIHRMPGGEEISTIKEDWDVGVATEEDKPVIQAMEIVSNKIAPKIAGGLKGLVEKRGYEAVNTK